MNVVLCCFLYCRSMRCVVFFFFFSSRRRHTRFDCDWSSDVCSSDLRARAALSKAGIDAIVAVGGEDTLGVAHRLSGDGVDVVGVPKTIDNDLGRTDFTFGFNTAVQVASDAIDRLHTTAESHNRVIVVEVMGRSAGWIATYSGMAGGADAIR